MSPSFFEQTSKMTPVSQNPLRTNEATVTEETATAQMPVQSEMGVETPSGQPLTQKVTATVVVSPFRAYSYRSTTNQVVHMPKSVRYSPLVPQPSHQFGSRLPTATPILPRRSHHHLPASPHTDITDRVSHPATA